MFPSTSATICHLKRCSAVSLNMICLIYIINFFLNTQSHKLKPEFMEIQNNQKGFRLRSQITSKGKLIDFIKKYQQKKQEQHIVKKKKKLVGFSCGQWNFRQTKLYVRYLQNHKKEFKDPILRKKNKVFIKLADFIGSRTADQCRSHHQKATRRFAQFDQLLKFYQNIIEQQRKKTQTQKQGQYQIENILQNGDNRIDANIFIQSDQLKIENVQLKKQQRDDRYQLINQVDVSRKNYQMDVQNQILQNKKEEKATDQVITKNYYRVALTEKVAKIFIQIEIGNIKQYGID